MIGQVEALIFGFIAFIILWIIFLIEIYRNQKQFRKELNELKEKLK